MPEYCATAIRRADASADMPLTSVILRFHASCEELAGAMAGEMVADLAGTGQMDLDELYEET